MLRLATVLVAISAASSGQYLEEGDICDSGWRCRKLSDCRTGQNDLKAGNNPKICSFDGTLPIVCCRPDGVGNRWPVPLPETTTPGRRPVLPSRPANKKPLSQRKCEEYAEYVYRKEQAPVLAFEPQTVRVNECGRVGQTLIVGGTDAKLKEFPHMAQIGYGNKPRIAWLCGGSLISERWLLSAAHCTNPESKGPAKWARLGDLDTASDHDGARPEVLQIVQRVDHPDYSTSRLYNDIALYKLERNINLNPQIRPICLQTNRYIDQRDAIASGWGHTNWGGRPSNILKKVSLKLVPTHDCNETYSDSIGKQLPNGISDSKMVCAGDEAGKDTCQGDSGGPLQIPLSTPYCMYAQIGVTSFGRGCAQDHPGVYTRVSFYVPWIESVVWPGQ